MRKKKRKRRKVFPAALVLAVLAAAAPDGSLRAAKVLGAQDDSGRTVVTMMYQGELTDFEALVEEKYPDVDLQVEKNTPATINGLSERRLRNGQGNDIILTTQPSNQLAEYALDLSAESYVMNYETPIMNSYMVDGKVKFIPLPGQYSGYIYNVTLARQLGITELATEDDLLALLEAAGKEGTGVGEDGSSFGFMNPDRYKMASYFMGTQIPDFLALPDGIIWAQKMHDGEETFAGAMDHCTEFASKMAEEGYLNVGGLSVSRTNATPVQSRMLDGTMIMAYGSMELYEFLVENSDEYEYDMIPFPGSGENHAWTVCIPDGFLAVNASAKEETIDACHRVMEVLATAEGQEAFMADSSERKSYLVGGVSEEPELPEGLKECDEDGYVYHIRVPGNVMRFFGEKMISVLEGKEKIAEALAEVDDYYYNGDEEADYDVSIVGTVAEDLQYENYNVRLEETALGNLMADALREVTGADMAFVNGGSIRGSLYEGDLYGYDLEEICPYDNQIVILEADGDTIWKMLENGISQRMKIEGVPGGRFLNPSGLCYSFKDESGGEPAELLSVTLPDGSPIDPEGTYTIAVTDYMAGSSGYLNNNGDGYTMLNVFSDTEPKASNVELKEETGKIMQDILRIYFQNHAHEAVTSKTDGRITISNENES